MPMPLLQRKPQSSVVLSIRELVLWGMARLPSGLLELVSLLLVYTSVKSTIYYVIELIGVFLLGLSDAMLNQFHSDQEVLLQGVSIFASFWLVRHLFRRLQTPSQQTSMRELVSQKQAGLHGNRLMSVLLDGLLKGLVMASVFLVLTTLLGLTQFEIAVMLDLRGFLTVLPLLAGQFLSFLLWTASLEILRRYLHRILVTGSSSPLLGICMTILSEAYLLYQVFSKPGQDSNQAIVLTLCCMILASAQLLWYRLGEGLPLKQQVRISMLRFGMTFGFWASLLFIYGWSMGSFRATSFINLFPVRSTSELSAFFSADQPQFLILVVWSFGFAASLVMKRLVRSVFRIFHLQGRKAELSDGLLGADELEFQS